MENNNIKTIADMKLVAPLSNDGIYLQGNAGNIIAVCSTPEIARLLVQTVNGNTATNNATKSYSNCKSSFILSFLHNLKDAISSLDEQANQLEASVQSHTDVEETCSSTIVNELSAKQIDSKSYDEMLQAKIKVTVNSYSDFVQKARYLDIAIQQAKIPVGTVNSMLLEKAYCEFKQSLDDLIKNENLEIVSNAKHETLSSVAEPDMPSCMQLHD